MQATWAKYVRDLAEEVAVVVAVVVVAVVPSGRIRLAAFHLDRPQYPPKSSNKWGRDVGHQHKSMKPSKEAGRFLPLTWRMEILQLATFIPSPVNRLSLTM
jgi:hypothetical protein